MKLRPELSVLKHPEVNESLLFLLCVCGFFIIFFINKDFAIVSLKNLVVN